MNQWNIQSKKRNPTEAVDGTTQTSSPIAGQNNWSSTYTGDFDESLARFELEMIHSLHGVKLRYGKVPKKPENVPITLMYSTLHILHIVPYFPSVFVSPSGQN